MKKKEMACELSKTRYELAALKERCEKYELTLLSFARICGYEIRYFTGDEYRNKRIHVGNGGITGRGYVIEGSGKREEHVDTDRVKNVTLEELARLVLDGTPIKRNETVEVEYAPECHVADKEEQASEADLL